MGLFQWVFGDNKGQDVGEKDEKYEKEVYEELRRSARNDELWRKSNGDVDQSDWDKHTRKK